jgi:hypothetical protein
MPLFSRNWPRSDRWRLMSVGRETGPDGEEAPVRAVGEEEGRDVRILNPVRGCKESCLGSGL